MLSVLKRTVSMRGFFWAKMMDKKIFTYNAKTFCLSKPMEQSGQTELAGFQNIPPEVEGSYKGKQQFVVHCTL